MVLLGKNLLIIREISALLYIQSTITATLLIIQQSINYFFVHFSLSTNKTTFAKNNGGIKNYF